MTGEDPIAALAARVARLEAEEEIRQLASRYAFALDKRDVQAMADLFVEDIATHGGGVGRDALAAWFDGALRSYGVSFHLVGNHIVDLVDEDHATGVVSFRAEHEVGDEWIVMPAQYWDDYERRAGRWYFASRTVHAFYAADLLENPTTVPGRWHFPDSPFVGRAELPERWDTWQEFWGAGGT